METTPKMTSRAVTLDIQKAAGVADLEALLARITAIPRETPLRLRVASTVEGGIFSDLWAAILVGTAARHHRCEIVARGLKEIAPGSAFASTPAFIATAGLATAIAPEGGEPISRERARKYLATRHSGLVDPESGSAQALVEFDPDYPTALVLRDRVGGPPMPPAIRSRLFQRLILDFRRRLEIGALRRRIDPQDQGPAGNLGKFLAELHENAAEHGSRGPDGRSLPGSRTMRIKKHLANNKAQLLERCGSLALLSGYVAKALPDGGKVGLVEASISDFGLGMVDGFLSTPAARTTHLRGRELLEALVYERLSAKSSDPSAGLGIQKALESAQRMNGLVSLRTGEFWLAASFADAAPGIRLADVPGGPHPKVAGTHWQLLWLQP